ncbi:MAG TPA: hypothetical protein VMY76_11080 [Gemmatimonadales bacterium]|nr:hypothetical protein [Gemmatimonadales bacterium]
MYLRAVAVWCGILVLASVNGAIRDLGLTPVLGDTAARALSTVVLAALVLLVAWATIGWIGPGDRRQARRIGLLWLALTLAFELLAGHYGFGKPWAELLADYDLSRGRIWILALLVTLGAPMWAAWRRGLPNEPGPR